MWPCCSVTCLQEVPAASNWRGSVLFSGVKWPALLPHCFLLRKNHGEMAGPYQVFFVPFTCHSRVILFHLPPLITQHFGRKEKKWLSLQSTEQPLGVLPLFGLVAAPHRSWERGLPYLHKKTYITLLAKSGFSLEAIYSQHSTMSQEGCKIHMDIDKPSIYEGSSKLWSSSVFFFLVLGQLHTLNSLQPYLKTNQGLKSFPKQAWELPALATGPWACSVLGKGTGSLLPAFHCVKVCKVKCEIWRLFFLYYFML